MTCPCGVPVAAHDELDMIDNDGQPYPEGGCFGWHLYVTDPFYRAMVDELPPPASDLGWEESP